MFQVCGRQPREVKKSGDESYGLFTFGDTRPTDYHNLDIVAVHGLGGHWERTWTYETGKLWLRDFLTIQLPNARIMSYGYNSETAFSKAVTDISDEAAMLLDRLDGERQSREEETRPIVFISHSLGGIVVKKALILAHERSSIYRKLLDSVRGCMFFGVPHRGSDAAYWASFAAKLLRAGQLGFGTNTSFVNALGTNSASLAEISQQFIERGARLEIRTFYETEKLYNQLIVDKHSARLGIANEIAVGIPGANHETMCKFEDAESQKYLPVWKALKKLANSAVTDPAPSSVLLSRGETKCLQFLYTSDYVSHRKRNPDRASSTCEWFLRHAKYQLWLQEQKSSLLLVSGDPGCGKSVLASFLVDKLNSSESQSKLPGTVCSFFFKDDNVQQKSATAALCALLHQLFTTKPLLVHHGMTEFRSKGRKFTEEFIALWKIFTTAATDSNCGNVICVIDGLDECEESTRLTFINSLVKFHSEHETLGTSNSLVKFIVTSRPYDPIERLFHSLPAIRLQAEGETEAIKADIGQVVGAKLHEQELRRRLSDDGLANLRESLMNNSHPTFLWVSLIFDILRDTQSDSKFNEILNSLPRDLDTVYENILRQSPNPQKAREILHMVVAAVRPLTLVEMETLLAIRPEHKSIEDLRPYLNPSTNGIVKEVCGPFVKIIDSKIYLVHHTAKEFLIKYPDDANSTSRSGKPTDSSHGTNSTPGPGRPGRPGRPISSFHNTISTPGPGKPTNSSHATNSNLGPGRPTNSSHATNSTPGPGRSTNSSHAINSTPESGRPTNSSHATNSTLGSERPASFSDDADSSSESGEAVSSSYNTSFSSGSAKHSLDPIKSNYILAERCVWYLLLSVFQNHSLGIDYDWSPVRNPAKQVDRYTSGHGFFNYAAKYWNVHFQKAKVGKDTVLMKSSFGVCDTRSKRFMTWFQVYSMTVGDHLRFAQTITHLNLRSYFGHDAAVQLLLEEGANVAAKDEYGRTALHWAAERGHEGAVRLLIDKGANVGANDDYGWPALYRAAESGHEAVVRLLVEKGADVRARDELGWTALHLAAKNGHGAVVQTLVEKGAYVGAKDELGWMALHWTARNGHEAVVQLLIDKGADLMAKDELGWTALHWATRSRHEAVLGLLVEKGADVAAKDRLGRTALLLAAESGHQAAVRVLVNKGADITAKTKKGWTALHGAARNRHEKVVRLLVDLGADVRVKNDHGHSALHWAARNGHGAVVQLLLNKGADFTVKSLRQAAERRYELVVQLLVEKRPHIGTMALHQAAKRGQEATMRLLVANGANFAAKDELGRMALHRAAKSGHADVVRLLLLEMEADIAAKDELGRVALHWAAKSGHADVVQLLLEMEADIAVKDGCGRTALHWAAERGARGSGAAASRQGS